MLVIRFFRVGKKNQPSFKIVVTDKRRPPSAGRFVEEVGFYNPLTKEKVLRAERIKHWLSVGAKPSDTVYNLLIKEKIIEGEKIPVHKKAKKIKEEAPTPEAPIPGVPKEEVPKKEEKPAGERPAEEKPKEEKPTKEIAKEEAPKKEEKESSDAPASATEASTDKKALEDKEKTE